MVGCIAAISSKELSRAGTCWGRAAPSLLAKEGKGTQTSNEGCDGPSASEESALAEDWQVCHARRLCVQKNMRTLYIYI